MKPSCRFESASGVKRTVARTRAAGSGFISSRTSASVLSVITPGISSGRGSGRDQERVDLLITAPALPAAGLVRALCTILRLPRASSGSLAMLAAMRRASSLVHLFDSDQGAIN
jgi:hypothetical protein